MNRLVTNLRKQAKLWADTINHAYRATLLRKAADRIEILETVIDKLPKTADGVPVVPGMKVYKRWIVDDSKVSGRIWTANDDREVEWIDEDDQIVFCDGDRYDIQSENASDYYSTEAGAEAAAQEGKA